MYINIVSLKLVILLKTNTEVDSTTQVILLPNWSSHTVPPHSESRDVPSSTSSFTLLVPFFFFTCWKISVNWASNIILCLIHPITTSLHLSQTAVVLLRLAQTTSFRSSVKNNKLNTVDLIIGQKTKCLLLLNAIRKFTTPYMLHTSENFPSCIDAIKLALARFPKI